MKVSWYMRALQFGGLNLNNQWCRFAPLLHADPDHLDADPAFRFDADADPVPTFQFDADQDPVTDPTTHFSQI
jgi:hypothetical protein